MKYPLTILAMTMFSSAVLAQSTPTEVAVLQTLKQKYSNTTFKSISATQIPGVYEVIMGKNVAYVDETGRYFLFGRLFDMQTQTDLTEPKLEKSAQQQPQISWEKLDRKNAIVTVRGNGNRKVAVFSDPDCPYCKRIEQTLEGIQDVTIYTFLMPLASLHPQAAAKAEGVWCAKDRSQAWRSLMLDGRVTSGSCENPIEANLAFAAEHGINGTPTLIFADGTVVPGAISAARIEQLLKASAEGAK